MKKVLLVAGFIVLVGMAQIASAVPWKFAVTADSRKYDTTGVNSPVVTSIANAIVAENVDFMIFTGDPIAGPMANGGTMTAQLTVWKTAMAPVYNANIPVYVVRGNHEIQNPDPLFVDNVYPLGALTINSPALTAEFQAFFPEMPQNGPVGEKGLTYSIDHNNARFVAIDNYAGRSATFNDTQYNDTTNSGMINQWALDQITNATADTPWVFAFGHEPLFVGHNPSCLANAYDERDALLDALGPKTGIYLTAHDHSYARQTAPDSYGHLVNQLMVASAGAGWYDLDQIGVNASIDHGIIPTTVFFNGKTTATNTNQISQKNGYLLVTIDGNTLLGEWKGEDGSTGNWQTYDSFTMIVPEPATLGLMLLGALALLRRRSA